MQISDCSSPEPVSRHPEAGKDRVDVVPGMTDKKNWTGSGISAVPPCPLPPATRLRIQYKSTAALLFLLYLQRASSARSAGDRIGSHVPVSSYNL